MAATSSTVPKKSCKCDEYLDSSHYSDHCWSCNSANLVFQTPICKCGYQCGHRLGAKCGSCKKPQMPKQGEGYCVSVRQMRHLMKSLGQCCAIGCQKSCAKNKDYCSYTHAKNDGAIN